MLLKLINCQVEDNKKQSEHEILSLFSKKLNHEKFKFNNYRHFFVKH